MKSCPFCHSQKTVKNGKKHHKQQYLCKSCGRQFLAGARLDNQLLWEQYTKGKQTLKQLAHTHKCSINTIKRHLDQHTPLSKHTKALSCKSSHLIIDATYFGQGFGIMVFMDNVTGMVLHHKVVSYETNALYRQGINHLKQRGITINSITCDGRRGLLTGFNVPTQMCQFHQRQIITRYLTRKPKHIASQELLAITKTLTHKDQSKDEFTRLLDEWYLRHEAYINERTTLLDDKGKTKSWYTHKRLRSAYRSLRANLAYLFTYQQDKTGNTPNTTNKLEGLFSHIKHLLRCHQGLSRQRVIKLIDDLLTNHGC